MTAVPETMPALRLPPLRDAARDVHSQNGEDGIIEEILRRLGELDRPPDQPLWCVEFGAWDGMHLSNTRSLIESRDACAVLIEPEEDRFSELVQSTAEHPQVCALHSSVDAYGPKRLDALLAQTECPRAFDLLSIDIDGHDYWVWEAVRDYHPLIVVIEYNPTIPRHIVYRSPPHPNTLHGSSLSAIRELGDEKGYTLAAVTETNCILVRTDRVPELKIDAASLDPQSLTEDLTDFGTYLFATPQGEIRIVGNRVLMWHGVVFDEAGMQPLPAYLRGHHDALGPIRSWLLNVLTRKSRARFEKRHAKQMGFYRDAVAHLRRLQKDDTP